MSATKRFRFCFLTMEMFLWGFTIRERKWISVGGKRFLCPLRSNFTRLLHGIRQIQYDCSWHPHTDPLGPRQLSLNSLSKTMRNGKRLLEPRIELQRTFRKNSTHTKRAKSNPTFFLFCFVSLCVFTNVNYSSTGNGKFFIWFFLLLFLRLIFTIHECGFSPKWKFLWHREAYPIFMSPRDGCYMSSYHRDDHNKPIKLDFDVTERSCGWG